MNTAKFHSVSILSGGLPANTDLCQSRAGFFLLAYPGAINETLHNR